VAAQAHNHMLVSKNTEKNITYSNITTLSGTEIIHEIARMLGGTNITTTTLSHAKEMIESNKEI
jgi:DNA repair protein RecN (Recombination protein N)